MRLVLTRPRPGVENPFPFVCDCGQAYRTAVEVVCCLLAHREEER